MAGRCRSRCRAVLVQVYAADADAPALRPILQQLREALPGAAIVGASTVGELADGYTLTERIVIGLSTFESTTVQRVVLPVQPGMEAVAASEAARRVLAGGGGVRAALTG
ncbi:MAG: FIST N-terminal domain-containing protein [Silanimonas lenta]